MDAIVDDRLVAEVPEVVLDEPQNGVGEDAVVQVVLLLRRHRVVNTSGGVEERNRVRRAGVRGQLPLIVVARARDPLGLGRLGQRE
jgi:hypothetical protein